MKKYVAMLIGAAVIAGYAASNHAKSVAAQTTHSSAQFTADGKLILPKGFRKWVFVGAPLTPNASTAEKPIFPSFITFTSRSKI